MSIEAKINEEAQLDQAEAQLSEEQLSTANGGAERTLRVADLRVATDVARTLDRTALLKRFDLLRNLRSIDVISNKEWQE